MLVLTHRGQARDRTAWHIYLEDCPMDREIATWTCKNPPSSYFLAVAGRLAGVLAGAVLGRPAPAAGFLAGEAPVIVDFFAATPDTM